MEPDCDGRQAPGDGWRALAFALFFTMAVPLAKGQCVLPGSMEDSVWSEQSLEFVFNPQVRVVVNAPSPRLFRDTTNVSLVFYALPNGNTIEQTAGKQVREGVDWHFGIQHIAAQMRLLRRRDSSTTHVVAYLETAQKSWPAWRRTTPESGRLIRALVDTVRSLVPGTPRVTLAGHSGGGSFLFGLMNSPDSIPAYVRRFVFLDANYEFDTTAGHDAKLAGWLRRSAGNELVVVAYDDRNITLNGKRVIGPSGGTFRRSVEMVRALRDRGIPLETSSDSAFTWHRSALPCVAIAIHRNPLNAILHTVLVERNGLLFGLSAFTPAQERGTALWGPPAYFPFIQP